MNNMFYNCTSVRTIDLWSWTSTDGTGGTTKTSTGSMFRNCFELQTIYVGSRWKSASDSSAPNMFARCYNILGGDGTPYQNSENPGSSIYNKIGGRCVTPYWDSSYLAGGYSEAGGYLTPKNMIWSYPSNETSTCYWSLDNKTGMLQLSPFFLWA